MSKNYVQIKKLMFTQPEVLHALLQKLADAVITYIKYQVRARVDIGSVWDARVGRRVPAGTHAPTAAPAQSTGWALC